MDHVGLNVCDSDYDLSVMVNVDLAWVWVLVLVPEVPGLGHILYLLLFYMCWCWVVSLMTCKVRWVHEMFFSRRIPG